MLTHKTLTKQDRLGNVGLVVRLYSLVVLDHESVSSNPKGFKSLVHRVIPLTDTLSEREILVWAANSWRVGTHSFAAIMPR